MEVYHLEASLLDIFNFCIACNFPIIDPDFAKGGHFYTVLQSNSAIKKVTVTGNPLVNLYLAMSQALSKKERQY